MSFTCCECGENTNATLIPRQCLAKHGYRGHRLCEDCWFGKFAKEGVTHKCPGCEKHLPLNNYSFGQAETVDLTDSPKPSRKRKRKNSGSRKSRSRKTRRKN